MSSQHFKICVLPGDGIGPEIMEQAIKVLEAVACKYGVCFECDTALIGGCAIDAFGTALPEETLALARECNAVLLGAVGGPKWDTVEAGKPRPEDGLLGIRKELGLFANLRPITVYDALVDASPLKADKVRGVDILIMRELTGGLYFGEHLTQEDVMGAGADGKPGVHAHDVMQYDEREIERIMRRGFDAAMKRRKKVASVDKANVLDTGQLWRKVAHDVAKDYPEIEFIDMLVDNAAMQLVLNPAQFDVIITENTFGDILSDEASVITGSLGMLASASLGDFAALYEPCHGSAPDIAGQNKANPIAQIQSAAMMLSYSFGMDEASADIDRAVRTVLQQGWRTADIAQACTSAGCVLGTCEMGDKIVACIEEAK